MTEFEICSSFRGCANRKNQIDIIRDMSELPKSKIFDILKSNNLIKTDDTDYEVLAKYCAVKKTSKNNPKSTKSVTSEYSKKSKSTVLPKTQSKKQNKPVVSDNRSRTVNLSSSINFISGQRFIGVPTRDIAESLGVSTDEFDDFYNSAKASNKYLGLIEKQGALGQIKSNLEKIENYTTYIESFIECGRVESVSDILDKQRELLSQSKQLIKMISNTNVVA